MLLQLILKLYLGLFRETSTLEIGHILMRSVLRVQCGISTWVVWTWPSLIPVGALGIVLLTDPEVVLYRVLWNFILVMHRLIMDQRLWETPCRFLDFFLILYFMSVVLRPGHFGCPSHPVLKSLALWFSENSIICLGFPSLCWDPGKSPRQNSRPIAGPVSLFLLFSRIIVLCYLLSIVWKELLHFFFFLVF